MKIPRPYQQEVINKIKTKLKESGEPILVDASVGSGKSLICAEILLWIEKSGYKALCITMNSTLISQNHETYLLQGGNSGIYCSSLGEKNTTKQVIFASPHSIVRSLDKNSEFSKIKFNLIIVDECHSINYHDSKSMMMRVINWFGYQAQLNNYSFRLIGLSGTCYRGKGISICGPDELFKTKACSISTSFLISNGYLVPASFGYHAADSYDYTQLRVNSMGKFNEREIQAIVDKNERLTGEIMREVSSIVENGHRGAFIFAATRKHCEECSRSLPEGRWAIITGETPHHERKEILSRARNGDCKYLISVNCLNVGVDVPVFDVAAWLRPTESLVLYTQGIGRVLRLSPGKTKAIVLDYAGNLDRHGDIDDPIINEALKPNAETEKDFVIPCYTCNTNNTVHARRCIGVIGGSRCDHYFQFKDCPECGNKNDITARNCRICDRELIDPNSKLKRQKTETKEIEIAKAKYFITTYSDSSDFITPVINAFYFGPNEIIFREKFSLRMEKSRNICYAKFIRLHAENPSKYYMHMRDASVMNDMVKDPSFKTPSSIIYTINEKKETSILKKIFAEN